MKKIIIFPAWGTIKLVRRFLPKDHPFKLKVPAITDDAWSEAFYFFGAWLWIAILSLVFAFTIILPSMH